MYKAILFDLDNTLLNYDRCESESMLLTGREHRLELWEAFTWERFWQTFGPINLTYWLERNERNFSIHQVLEYSFHDTLAGLRQDLALARPLAETYWHHFCSICHFEDETVPDLLHGFKRTHKLGIVSNGIGEAQRKRLAKGGIDSLFDSLVMSDEVGLSKPNPGIFEVALAELGMKRSEVLFVGDSLTDDLAGASRFGIDFCLYDRKGVHHGAADRPRYIVTQLGQLRDILAP